MRVYPQPGTNADRILSHIRAHPGVSRNGIITALGLNPGVVRVCMRDLIKHGLVEDNRTEEGNHAYRGTVVGTR